MVNDTEVQNNATSDDIVKAADDNEQRLSDWIDYEKTEQAKIDDALMQEIADMFNKWIEKRKVVTKEDIAFIVGVIKMEILTRG